MSLFQVCDVDQIMITMKTATTSGQRQLQQLSKDTKIFY
jgi:hypothetical protein